jgi:imidazoleglycerol-phosphate dehydratase/histidinol-phosphatase
MRKKLLLIDRDGTIIKEPPITFQVDELSQIEFLPGVIRNLYNICKDTNYEMVMVTNQDGLGTDSYPQDKFDAVQNMMLNILENEGIKFADIHIDKSFEHEQLPTRKPGIGMLTKYFNEEYDLANSYVIGDRTTDIQLARNLGAKSIFIHNGNHQDPSADTVLVNSWDEIYELLRLPSRAISHERNTKETQIRIELNPDGTGMASIATGLSFFDHMLEQIARHGQIDLSIETKGDLHIDEHHTIEDTAIALGEAFALALKDKRGMERYGFTLPMDDCLAQVAIDFGGRNWIVWEAEFNREKVGDVPTEMFYHFFKSFSDAAKCNLNIKVEGANEHHKIESIFKAFAKAIRMAVKRDVNNMQLPSTKGVL